ncbi:unsaturated rhamnogalacturonyl hydrolase [Geosporobacter subterraneus DSM 17957]|uniref:Unsaturated rhamnogalacturonyl hydrolase n=1 Tax=Geosporobacter subterraneus DSM 17957 TaxID=1121919 RepID=A0A1M6D9N1_9FIRM|nr:glycoside hydrolase family 88 protein [Geosporobacter subterraneus]SHI69869.1 unsaturated rhamnogalacturonyl hydrolase [Geosporobacter subterraneus DSM 17957]
MKILDFAEHYINNYKRYKEKWNYEDGCIFKGALDLYKATQDKKYFQFVLDHINEAITEEGSILKYEVEEFNIDNINCGKVLFDLYEATGDGKYVKAIHKLYEQLKRHPRTEEGNYWHKKIYPNQVWLDGLYMAMPFYAKYEKEFKGTNAYEDIYKQLKVVRERMFDDEKSLYYHGYDESRKERWSNPETGLSPNFWSRSMGWLLMAFVDILEILDRETSQWTEIRDMFEEAVAGVLKYQDVESSMWYQVIDKPEEEGNYLETSGTLMIAYGILKGVRLGCLPDCYRVFGEKAFEGTIKKYLDIEKKELGGICGVAGLGNMPYRDGSYAYYISEPILPNDHKGVGALFMAYGEVLKLTSDN